MQHQIRLNKSKGSLVLVSGLANLKRVTKQRPRFGPGEAEKPDTVTGGF
jgi:hypothetical protein